MNTNELPAPEAEGDYDSTLQEAVHVAALSQFQKQCAAAYEKDPAFQGDSLLSQYKHRNGHWWAHGDKLIISDADVLRREVLREMHDSPPHAGHVGVKRTTKAIQRYYAWPSLIHDAEHWVQTCEGCQRNKASISKQAVLLQPLPVPKRKWGSVSMDHVTALPETTLALPEIALGNTAIAVVVDRLTKMTHLVPCKTSIDTQVLAKLLRHEIIRLRGLPYEFVSDHNARFTRNFMREVCRLLYIQQAMSTAYHSQTDGQTERANSA